MTVNTQSSRPNEHTRSRAISQRKGLQASERVRKSLPAAAWPRFQARKCCQDHFRKNFFGWFAESCHALGSTQLLRARQQSPSRWVVKNVGQNWRLRAQTLVWRARS
jgi:hypothetical protein